MSQSLTTAQLAVHWGVSSRTVRRMCSTGFVPAERAVGCRGGKSGLAYRVPIEALQPTRPVAERARPEAAPIVGLNVFLSRGGKEAVFRAADRRDLAEAARSITGPGRTARLRALAQSAGTSLATLYRWMTRGTTLEGAATTLRRKRDEYGQRIRNSIEPEARDFFLSQWNDQKKLPVTAVIEHLYKPKAAEMGWRVPSRATFYRLVSQDLSAIERKAGREGIGALRRETLPKNTLAFPTEKNLVWVSDHRQFDAWAINPATGKAERPWLTSIMDTASRAHLGYTISFAPNGDAIVKALHRAVYAGAPFTPSLPIWFLEDNGQDYRSKLVTGTLELLGIRQRQCEVESPWQKGTVESFFKLVGGHFDKFLGWAGNNPLTRPELMDEKQRAADGLVYELNEFEACFERFNHWYHHEHQHTGDGMNGKTPAERYSEIPSARMGVPTAKTWSLLAMREERRKVSDAGIRIWNRLFWHDALFRMDNPVRRSVVDEWVTVRFDPQDQTRIFIFFEGEFVCTATDKPRPTFAPESEENMEVAGRVRSLNKQVERQVKERMHERAAKAGVNPWIPPLGKPDKPEPDAAAAADPGRMVTKMDRVAKQIDEQKQKDEAPRKRDESVSAVLRQRSNKFA